MGTTSGSSTKQNSGLTMHDPVTGLANREFLDIRLDFIISDTKANKEPLALVRLKLEHEKQLKKSDYKEIAQILKRQTRLSDFLARYDDNEFVIVLTNVDQSLADEIVDRLKTFIEDETGIATLIGMALYQEGLHGKDLLEQAEKALS